jgi:hypothetical protein
MLLNDSEHLKDLYYLQWYLSVILASSGILIIIYTSVRVGRHIPMKFSIALIGYFITYLVRLLSAFLNDKKLLLEFRTFTTTIIINV